ncbi:uncharacterized protein LOC125956466 isoform X4 [Anopheles darlingi]|nr:uncharacterized protein LOC125956466 isoform X4 [Anopheles darlingi]
MNKKLSPAAKFRRRLAAMQKKSNTTTGGRNRKQPKEQFFEHDIRFNVDNSPPQDDLVDPPDSSTNPEQELENVAEEQNGQDSHGGVSSVSDYERDPCSDRKIKSAIHRNDNPRNPENRLRNSKTFLRKNRRPNGLPMKHPRKTNGPSWNNRRLLLKLQQQLKLQGLCISSLVTMPASNSGTDPKRATTDTGEAAGGCHHCHCACAISNPVSTTGERLVAGHKHATTCQDGDGWPNVHVNTRRQHGAVPQPRTPLSCNLQRRPRGYHSELQELNSSARASRSSSCDSIGSGWTKERAALCQLREQYRAACSYSPTPSSWQNRNLHLPNRHHHHHQPYHHRYSHNHHGQEQLQQHKLCIKTTTAAAAARPTSAGSKSPALSPICMQAMHSVVSVRETHHIAQAQQEKNAKLRDAFGISQYFVEGTSFDQDRKAKEDLAKSEALQKELAEKEKAKELERANRKRYALVRTPSPEKERDKSADRNGAGKRGRDRDDGEDDDEDEGGHDTGGKLTSKASRGKDEKKKKKKKARDTSSSPERKKDKKKKSKKSKKER